MGTTVAAAECTRLLLFVVMSLYGRGSIFIHHSLRVCPAPKLGILTYLCHVRIRGLPRIVASERGGADQICDHADRGQSWFSIVLVPAQWRGVLNRHAQHWAAHCPQQPLGS
jgi:hypothetical protein